MSLPFFPYRDLRLRYFGKWQEEDGQIVSYGTVCFLKLCFKGSTVGIAGNAAAPICAFLDGRPTPLDFDGTIRLSAAYGVHTLVIRTAADRAFTFRGVEVEELVALPERKRPYIKFIGDSITNADPGFFAVTGSLLDADHSNDSVCGMSLSDGWGWPKDKSPKVGMESYYFRACHSQFDTAFSDYAFRFDSVPDACVVFLGTNDYLDSPGDRLAGHITHFARHYADFIEKLAVRYPTADFYIFRPLSDKHCRKEGIEAAFAQMRQRLGDRVTLLPTDTWGIALSPDGTHPSAAGYADLGIRLAAFLAPKLCK